MGMVIIRNPFLSFFFVNFAIVIFCYPHKDITKHYQRKKLDDNYRQAYGKLYYFSLCEESLSGFSGGSMVVSIL